MNGKFDLKTILMACGVLVGCGVFINQFRNVQDTAVSRQELKTVLAQRDLVNEKRWNKFGDLVDAKLDKILQATRR